MTMGHIKGGRPFRPSGKGGGSKKGKPQKNWPLILLVVGDAVFVQFQGSMDALLKDRAMIGIKKFGKRMDDLTPGWREWHEAHAGPRVTPREALLHNRVYKMYYWGSSAGRDEGHDPETRAAISPEHWTLKVGTSSPLRQLHEDIIRGLVTTIANWEEYL